MKLYVNIKFYLNEEQFETETNVKKGGVKSLIAAFLHTQIGAGVDKTPLNEQDQYLIKLSIDLSKDRFICSHNCGNLGLRDGILQHFLAKQ